MEERKGRVSYVIGPDGSPLTLADLPPASTRRWVIRRKAEVVAAVRGGLLSLDFGRSYTYSVPVIDLVRERLAVSLPLALIALALSTIIAIPVGLFSASRRGRAGDTVAMGAA